MKVLVTGAAGFIGQAVISELGKHGHKVRAMVRNAEQQRVLPQISGLDVVVADVTDPASLAAALPGNDVVIHLAGVVWGEPAHMHRIMVEGTANLIQAMQQAGVSRMVLASSFSVYDWRKVDNILTESTPLADDSISQQGPYSSAKTQQELTARQLCKQHGIHLAVLRPAAVVAPGKYQAADLGPQLGPLQVVIAPQRKLRLVKVEHAAAAFAAACLAKLPDGFTVNLVDDDSITAWQLAARIRRDSSKFGLLLPLPYGLLMGIARLLYPLCKLLGLTGFLPGLLIPERIACRFKSVACDNSVWQRYLPLPTASSSQKPC